MYLFKEGVKPLWEDVNNLGGGCFKIKIEKKRSNKLWESTLFAMISPKNRNIDVMNGIRIKIREKFDEIELWMNSTANDKERLEGLKQFLKENTQITDDRVFNFFPFSKK
jgi:translation initiation factor 4E